MHSTKQRLIALAVTLAIPAVFLTACGGDDKADSTTTTAAKSSDDRGSSTSTSDSGSDSGSSGNAKIDDFCQNAKEVADLYKQGVSDKDTAKLKEAAEKSKELAKQAQDLASEVIKDPSLATKLTSCTNELSDVAGS